MISLSFWALNNKNCCKAKFLAGLHKVHPAYRMVNARRAGWIAGERL
jgi:hypothetical protein